MVQVGFFVENKPYKYRYLIDRYLVDRYLIDRYLIEMLMQSGSMRSPYKLKPRDELHVDAYILKEFPEC